MLNGAPGRIGGCVSSRSQPLLDTLLPSQPAVLRMLFPILCVLKNGTLRYLAEINTRLTCAHLASPRLASHPSRAMAVFCHSWAVTVRRGACVLSACACVRVCACVCVCMVVAGTRAHARRHARTNTHKRTHAARAAPP